MSKLVDLTRQRFGKLSVIERVENLYGAPAWRCKCDCGNEKVIGGGNLRNGYTTSCGCQRLGKRVINLVGQKFGKLTVIKRAGTQGNLATWRCICDCETEVVVRGTHLRQGNIRSCGCLRLMPNRIYTSTLTHGEAAINNAFDRHQRSAKLRG